MVLDRCGVRPSATGQESVMKVGPFNDNLRGRNLNVCSQLFHMKALASCAVTGTRPSFQVPRGLSCLQK